MLVLPCQLFKKRLLLQIMLGKRKMDPNGEEREWEREDEIKKYLVFWVYVICLSLVHGGRPIKLSHPRPSLEN